jgi:hypothetical protein
VTPPRGQPSASRADRLTPFSFGLAESLLGAPHRCALRPLALSTKVRHLSSVEQSNPTRSAQRAQLPSGFPIPDRSLTDVELPGHRAGQQVFHDSHLQSPSCRREDFFRKPSNRATTVEMVGRYECDFQRGPRGGWVVAERYWRLDEGTGPLASTEDLFRLPPRQPPGTLAAAAYRAWLTTKRRHAATLRALVQGAPLSDRQSQRLVRASRSGLRWAGLVPDAKGLWMVWHVEGRAGVDDPFPMAAVLVSASVGVQSGSLRPCSRCGSPFVASPRTRRVCGCVEHEHRHRQEADWRRVRDRLRKGHHPATKGLPPRDRRRVIQTAQQDLWRMSLQRWRLKWDLKDPFGRGRPRASAHGSTSRHEMTSTRGESPEVTSDGAGRRA